MNLQTLGLEHTALMRNLRISHAIEMWGNRLRFLHNQGLSVEHILGYQVMDLVDEPEELTLWWRQNRDRAFELRKERKPNDVKPEPPPPRIINEGFNLRPEWWDRFVSGFLERFK